MRKIALSYQLSAQRERDTLIRNQLMDLLQAVRTAGSISAAARKLALTPSAVSKLVNRLEMASYQQSRAILLAALFIVSGLITQIESGPHFLGLHVLGILSLMGCTIYWAWMLINIWWTERGHRS